MDFKAALDKAFVDGAGEPDEVAQRAFLGTPRPQDLTGPRELGLWDEGSARFVGAASGEVIVLGSNVQPQSVFSLTEARALLENDNFVAWSSR